MVEPHGVHHLVLDVSDEVGALPDVDGLGDREGPVGTTDLGVAGALVQEGNVDRLKIARMVIGVYKCGAKLR